MYGEENMKKLFAGDDATNWLGGIAVLAAFIAAVAVLLLYGHSLLG